MDCARVMRFTWLVCTLPFCATRGVPRHGLVFFYARYPGQDFPRCCTSSQVGTDSARGSLALMSNESMIRGGGPEAWRHLDLADEAKSKPRCPFLRFFHHSLFATSASSYSRLVFLLF